MDSICGVPCEYCKDVKGDLAGHSVYEGDIIRVKRLLYWHYGIVQKDGRIVHYSSYPFHWWQKPASVRVVSWHQFLKSSKRYEIYYRAETPFERKRIIERALLRMGEEKYSLLFNNCKKFVDDCKGK